METLAIQSKKPFSLGELMETLSKHWRVEPSTDDTLAVHGSDSRIYIYQEHESNDIDVFKLLVDYSDVQFVKAVLEKIADDPELIVDNDFGTVLSGSEFVARSKADPDWNWRGDV